MQALTRLARGKLGSGSKSYADWTARLAENASLWDDYQSKFLQSDATPVRPERLMQALSRVVPENAIFATDVGVHHNWVVQLWKTRRPRHLLQSWGFAAMGYATSGILGAKLAKPDVPAVAVVGDGSFLMTPHVLATAVEYDIPAVWVVWNNYGYCSIRDMQLGLFKTRRARDELREVRQRQAHDVPTLRCLRARSAWKARASSVRETSRARSNRDQGEQAVSRGGRGRSRDPAGRHRHVGAAAVRASGAELPEACARQLSVNGHRLLKRAPTAVERE